jgi:hypothetical protein
LIYHLIFINFKNWYCSVYKSVFQLKTNRFNPAAPRRVRFSLAWMGHCSGMTRHTATWVNAAVSKDLKTRVDALS